MLAVEPNVGIEPTGQEIQAPAATQSIRQNYANCSFCSPVESTHKNLLHRSSISIPIERSRKRGVCTVCGRGLWISFIPASSGVRLPLRWLSLAQQETKFDHDCEPPLDFGITWSSVSSLVLNFSPQYMQRSPSRRKMFFLLTTCILIGTWR